MIQNDAQFEQTQHQLRMMQESLRSLKADVLPKNKRNFAVLAEGPLEEIRRLQSEIDAYMGVATAVESQSPLWLRLFGENVRWPSAPSSLLTNYLESLRKGVQTVAEYLHHGEVSGGRPVQELRDACDFEVVAFQPGSIRVGLRLPDLDVDELLLNQPPNPAEQALDEFLEAAAWAGSGENDAFLENKFADATKRRILLNALKPLLPRPRGQVEGIELSGWRLRGVAAIKLSRDTNKKVDGAIDRTVHEQAEEHEGDLREIDLDELRFTLRDPATLLEVRCVFEESILEQAKAALDKRVRVSGTRKVALTKKASPILQLTRLQVLDDEKPDVMQS